MSIEPDLMVREQDINFIKYELQRNLRNVNFYCERLRQYQYEGDIEHYDIAEFSVDIGPDFGDFRATVRK